jgi:hypothetical protein
MDANAGGGTGAGTGVPTPTTPPPTPPTPQNPPIPPPSGTGTPQSPVPPSGTPPTKPTEDGNANPTRTKNVFAGMDPRRISAIKRAVIAEVQPSLQAQAQQEADKAAGKWQDLYQKAEPKLKEYEQALEERDATLEQYQVLVNKSLDERVKNWPKDWLDGDPRKKNPDAPLEDVIAWMDWAEPLVTKQLQTPPPPGNPPNPASNGHGAPETPDQLKAYEMAAAERHHLNI